MLKWFLLIFGIIAVIMIFVTVVLIVTSRRKLKNYEEGTGTILRFCQEQHGLRTGSDKRRRIYPEVKYFAGGKEYQFFANFYSTNMEEGQEIKIMYSREDPSKATIKTGLYIAPLITGILSAVVIIVCVILAVLIASGAGM